jgi:hypothetical protein
MGSPIFLLGVAENPGNSLRPISPPRTVLRRTYCTQDDALTGSNGMNQAVAASSPVDEEWRLETSFGKGLFRPRSSPVLYGNAV